MEYKGYFAKVEFDNGAGLLHGQIVNIRDTVTFQGRSVDEVRQAFNESVEDYLAFCAERGEEPEKPFSGRFLVRTEPSLHRQVAIAADRAGQSVNAWVNAVLLDAVQPHHSQPTAKIGRAAAYYQAVTQLVSIWTGEAMRVASGPIKIPTTHKSAFLEVKASIASIDKSGLFLDMEEAITDAY
jgi:predicted HicB family RNase H-like nuclease